MYVGAIEQAEAQWKKSSTKLTATRRTHSEPNTATCPCPMADHALHHIRHLQRIIVTPEATALDTPANVAMPLFDGEAGIAPGRAPLIGRLGYGELRVRNGEKTKRYYVEADSSK